MRLRAWPLAMALALLAACGGGGSADPTTPTTADLGSTLTASIASVQTGMTYRLQIWLPPEYGQGSARFPVVYATDCEYRFDTLVTVLQRRHAQGRSSVLLVNICAGDSARRWVDFTLPGAVPYFRFLTQELVPAIDAQYRTDTGRRILSGHSLSGEFALYAMYLDTPAQRTFGAILSEECSCWYDANHGYSMQLPEALRLEQAMADASPVLAVDLVLAGDWTSNQPAVQTVYERLLARQFRQLRMTQPTYSQGHVPMDGPAFENGLDFIFGGR